MEKAKLILMVILLTGVFTVGTLLAPLFLVVRPSAVFKAMNRLCGAAFLGFDGKKTISAECGERLRAKPDCKPCKKICRWLAYGDPGHCEKEAN